MSEKFDKIGGKKLIGKVIKVSTDKTIKVQVEIKKADALYGKTVRSHKSYLVHNDPASGMGVEGIHEGDVVVIGEHKPISKTKKFILIEKVEK